MPHYDDAPLQALQTFNYYHLINIHSFSSSHQWEREKHNYVKQEKKKDQKESKAKQLRANAEILPSAQNQARISQ